MKIKNHNQGFTLLELLVVVLIIGILVSIALPQYEKTVWKARFAEVYTVTNALEKSIESYVLTHTLPEGGNSVDLDPEELDIDVLSNLTKKSGYSPTRYCSKYVCYTLSCNNRFCQWVAWVFTNPEQNYPSAEMIGTYYSSGWDRECRYEESLGKSICESGNWDAISEGF